VQRARREGRRRQPEAAAGPRPESREAEFRRRQEALAPLLLHAVLKGDAGRAEELLAQGAPCEAEVSTGATALVLAAATGDAALVELLLRKGADRFAQDNAGASALCMAALRGRLAVARALLADVPEDTARQLLEQRTAGGESPLLAAAKGGHREVLAFLLDSGADIRTTAASLGGVGVLGIACRKGKAAVLQLLIDRGLSVETADGLGMRPLMHAAASGQTATVDAVLHLAPAPQMDAKDNLGLTAAMHACWGGHLEVLKVLEKQGADLKARDNNNNSIAWYAAASGNCPLLLHVLEKNIGLLDARNSKGRSPIYAAVKCRKAAAVTELLKQGCSIGIKDNRGWTPLAWTAANNVADMAALLVAKGADLRATDDEGRVPRQIAEDCGHSKLGQMFAAKAKEMLLLKPELPDLLHKLKDKSLRGGGAAAEDRAVDRLAEQLGP